jgi:hypothetical protein
MQSTVSPAGGVPPTGAHPSRKLLATRGNHRRAWKLDDRWNWLMIGLIVGAVVVALYGPLVWETHARCVTFHID